MATGEAPVERGPASGAAERARQRDRRHVWHTWSPLSADRSELMLSYGAGYRVWDVDGREYLDACSLNSTCGYGHPDVIRAVTEQMSRLHHVDISLSSHEPVGLLAERISSYLPGGPVKTLFVNSGSEGFDAAVMMAAAFWSHLGRPRSRLVSFARGYQGSTLLSRSLSRLPRTRHLLHEPVPVTLTELPVAPGDLRRADALPLLLAEFARAIGDDEADLPMAVVVEPFLNVGGGIVLPPGFLKGIRELTDATGTLLIVDEVFTAYGRLGGMFACQREDVAADIVVSSKGLSGGYVPIAAVSALRRVHDTFAEDPVIGGLRYGHTTSGHAVACAAALATLDVIEKEGLAERAESLGARLRAGLASVSDADDVVDVRGVGLIGCVELRSVEDAAGVVARARQSGLLLRQQLNAVMAVPPLIIDADGIDDIVDRMRRSLPR